MFEFANALWTQPQLRAAVVAQAAEFRTATTGQGGEAQQPGAERVIKEFERLEAKAGLPPGWDMKKIGLFLSGDRETWDAAFSRPPESVDRSSPSSATVRRRKAAASKWKEP